jgi:AraC-like DNA-binding protein
MSLARTLEGVVRAKELIDARYCEPLEIPDLAGAARLSEAHFIRAFHRTVGQPPHQYLIARRMEHAALLLRSTDRPVAEICRLVGFRGVGSFTTRFGRTFGESPRAYRASGREDAPGSGGSAPLL